MRDIFFNNYEMSPNEKADQIEAMIREHQAEPEPQYGSLVVGNVPVPKSTLQAM